jgi:hypothetical protein
MYVTLNSTHTYNTYIFEKICMCRIHTCMYAKWSQTFAHIHLYVHHWSKLRFDRSEKEVPTECERANVRTCERANL